LFELQFVDSARSHGVASRLLKTFKTASSIMASTGSTRQILPDEKGVEYHNGSQKVIWTFDEVTIEVSEETTFTNLQDGSTFTAQSSTVLPKHSVFQIGRAS
jgi:hypothetical protein